MKCVIFLTIFLMSVNVLSSPIIYKKTNHKCDYVTLKTVWDNYKTKGIYTVSDEDLFLYGTVGPEAYSNKPGLLANVATDKDKIRAIYNHTPKEVWRITKKYHKKLGISLNDACFYAAGGMAAAMYTKDRFSSVYLPNIKKPKEVKGDIGVTLVGYSTYKRVFINKVYKNSSAYKAGIRAFDEILFINGGDIKKIKPKKVFELFSGEKGVVSVTIRRSNKTYTYIVIKTEKYTPLSNCYMRNKIPVCTINTFSSMEAYWSLLKSLKALPKHEKKIVVDLRTNGGGGIEVYKKIVSLWIGKREAGTLRYKTYDEVLRGTNKALLWDYKTVILTDHDTASASEMFINALKYYNIAVTVGEQTYGKGVMRKRFYTSGIYYYITSANILDLNKKKYHGKGIKPFKYSGMFLFTMILGMDTPVEDALKILNPK